MTSISGQLELPLIDSFDVVVTEGTACGLELALALADAGVSVAVVSAACSLPFEVVSCLRAWVDPAGAELHGRVGEALENAVKPDGTLHLGKASEFTEDLLIDAGVTFFYDAHLLGAISADGDAAGIVVGGKFGMAVLGAELIVDTTQTAMAARSLGATFDRRREKAHEISLVLHAPAGGDSARSGSGYTVLRHGPYVELRIPWTGEELGEFSYACAVRAARYHLLEIAEREPAPFEGARAADDVIVGSAYRLENGLSAHDALTIGAMQVSHTRRVLVAGPQANVADAIADSPAVRWAAGAAAAADIAGDVVALAGSLLTGDPGKRILSASRLSLSRALPQASAEAPAASPASFRINGTDPGFDQPGACLIEVAVAGVPVAAEGDVVVAGAGTAGLPAAAVAARHGSSVLCNEKHADPGGANTTGGVAHYWFGHWSTYFRRHFKRLLDFEAHYRLPPAFAQLQMARESGVAFLPRTPTVGTVTRRYKTPAGEERSAVVALLVAGSNGLAALSGQYFADATGDGDVAAWSDAPYTYGSERDEITYWCSFGKFHAGRREASRQYLSVADQRGIRDITRAVVAGRRQAGIFGEAESPQFYLVNRESRHVLGGKRLGYVEMLCDVDYHDAAFVCTSNVDIKGLGSSDASLAGFAEPKLLRTFTTHIPFAAMVPRSIDNLVIAGRAYSASHDALGMARMQSDMITMGASAGATLDFVRRRQVAVPSAPIAQLQSIWTEIGTIEPHEIVGRRDHEEYGLSDFDLEVLCNRVARGPVDLAEEARVLAQRHRAVPYLRRALGSAVHGRDVVIARMLCCLGDSSGNDVVLNRLEDVLREPSLPEYPHRRHLFPDHGFAPEAVYLVQALSLTGEKRLVDILRRIVDALELDPETSDSMFTYAYAVCYAADRIACVELQRPLAVLADKPAVAGRIVGPDDDLRAVADPVAERYAYIELSCFRALARCGSRRGWQGLITYLADRRSFLHRSARLELRDLAGADLRYNQDAWSAWLEGTTSWQIPQPLTRRFD